MFVDACWDKQRSKTERKKRTLFCILIYLFIIIIFFFYLSSRYFFFFFLFFFVASPCYLRWVSLSLFNSLPWKLFWDKLKRCQKAGFFFFLFVVHWTCEKSKKLFEKLYSLFPFLFLRVLPPNLRYAGPRGIQLCDAEFDHGADESHQSGWHSLFSPSVPLINEYV